MSTVATVPAPPGFVESAIFLMLPEYDTLAKIRSGIHLVDEALKQRLVDKYPPLPSGYVWHRDDEIIGGFPNACRIRYRARYVGTL